MTAEAVLAFVAVYLAITLPVCLLVGLALRERFPEDDAQ